MDCSVGVIGLGVGEAHLRAVEGAYPEAVKAVCDLDSDKADRLKDEFPHVRVYGTARELIESADVDLVCIASYDQDHADQVLWALEADKKIFVEKPLCLTREDADRIYEKLRQLDFFNPFSSNLILRRSPRFIEMKKRVEAGSFGDLYYVEGDYNYGRLWKITDGWRGSREEYSVTVGGGIHMVDFILWLKDQSRVSEVFAFGAKIVTQGQKNEFDDCVVASFKFEDGSLAKVTSNFGCVQSHFHPFSIYGTKASAIHRPDGVEWYEGRDDDQRPMQKLDLPYPGVEKGALFLDFYRVVLERNTEAEVGPSEIFAALEVCFAIEESRASGRPVRVEYRD